MKCVTPGEQMLSIPPNEREYVLDTIGRRTLTSLEFRTKFKANGFNHNLPIAIVPILTDEEETEYLADPALFETNKLSNRTWLSHADRSFWIVDGGNRSTLCKTFKFNFSAVILHPRMCYRVAETICLGVNEGSSHAANVTAFLARVVKVGEWTSDGLPQPTQSKMAISWGGTGRMPQLNQCYRAMMRCPEMMEFMHIEMVH
jgi:hypothetical protein